MPSLIASTDSQRLFNDILPWLGALLGVVLVGAVAIYVVRRTLTQADRSARAGFTLQDLRDMHAKGELSDEEFARAREQMLGRSTTATTSTRRPSDSTNTSGGP